MVVAACLAALAGESRVACADPNGIGVVAKVQRNAYGTPPNGVQAVERAGDGVVFKELIETLRESAAVLRFIDNSRLTLGAQTKVVIDEFVFDPTKAQGNALISISLGTLRFVTGGMPKGGTVIKTPTATLTLRGTDVTVHVHPDGTTDTDVNEGDVDDHNDLTGDDTSLGPGQGATSGPDGNSDHDPDGDPTGDGTTDNGNVSTVEQRRGDHTTPPTPPSTPNQPAPSPPPDDCEGGCE